MAANQPPLRTTSIARRESKVHRGDLAQPAAPGVSFGDWLAGAAILFNSTATAKGAPAGLNIGVFAGGALGVISGGMANGNSSVVVDGGSALVQGAILLGGIVVKNNSERPFASVIANSTGMEGTLTANNGTLSVTNSSLAALSVSW